MSKFSLTKFVFGVAAAGVAAATAYTFYKKYKELAPKPLIDRSADGEAKMSIDREAAKQAAGETFEIVKKEAVKAAQTVADSAKAVGKIAMDRYGDNIQAAKGKAGEKFAEAKEFAGEKFTEAKEYVGEKFAQAKEFAREKYDEFSQNNPKVAETIENVKDGAVRTYTTVKEKVGEFVEGFKSGVEDDDDEPIFEEDEKSEFEATAEKAAEAVGEAVDEAKDTIKEAVSDAKEAAEDVKEEAKKTTEDFIQNL